SIGGDGSDRVLRWTRAQQAAFLLKMWQVVADEAANSKSAWAVSCRTTHRSDASDSLFGKTSLDPAFAGRYTLLATDQGVRAISYVFNAMSQVRYSELALEESESEAVEETMTDE